MDLIIPPEDSILQTSEEDIKQYYYSQWRLVRHLYRKRLAESLKALEGKRYDSMLELGTGSGIFLYSLSKLAKHVIATDTHLMLDDVKRNLQNDGLKNVTFMKADINKIPHPDKTFDAVVAISILEHIHTLPTAITEIKRVMKDDGVVIIGIPANNLVMHVGFFLIGAHDVGKHHHHTHETIIEELQRQFRIERIKSFPLLPMYYVITCKKRE